MEVETTADHLLVIITTRGWKHEMNSILELTQVFNSVTGEQLTINAWRHRNRILLSSWDKLQEEILERNTAIQNVIQEVDTAFSKLSEPASSHSQPASEFSRSASGHALPASSSPKSIKSKNYPANARQHHHVSSISGVPTEILIIILSMLPMNGLLQAMRVCRSWNDIIAKTPVL
ncbi:hypothetical protein DM02DRAFT_373130 [Periconia macrospinosa]|uniref:F-box domain-containing protein n=1 Tax=Periconia macrospinosa TaxID=97972 RepID=A0A2V1CZ98_9PLEO|nr:hypothetical protein DM02DRAFT_373130 [Periconia macrospinosa]